MAKYTKFCSAESLIKNIEAEEKDEVYNYRFSNACIYF